MSPRPPGCLTWEAQVGSTRSASGRTSSWVVLEVVLFENGSKTCKRDKAEKCVLESSVTIVWPGSVWYLVLSPPRDSASIRFQLFVWTSISSVLNAVPSNRTTVPYFYFTRMGLALRTSPT